jgi:GT2 family glycosyltransferase
MVADTRAFVRHRNQDGPGKIAHLAGDTISATEPVLSLIIPTSDGNRHGYLPRLLAQLEQQTFQDFEVIIVQGDPRQGRAINTAAGMAQGRILVTFDDDTRLGDERVLENLLRAIDFDPRIGMVGGANVVPPDASWLVCRIMREVPRRSSPPVPAITDSDLAEHPCLAIRKDVFYAIGGEHEIIPRGLDPYLRQAVRNAGYRVVVAPGIVYHHLPPPTLLKSLRQFYRNGRMSALVSWQFPELALENALQHGQAEIVTRPFWFRAVRHGGRMLAALLSLQWVYLATASAYGLGVVAGRLMRPFANDR